MVNLTDLPFQRPWPNPSKNEIWKSCTYRLYSASSASGDAQRKLGHACARIRFTNNSCKQPHGVQKNSWRDTSPSEGTDWPAGWNISNRSPCWHEEDRWKLWVVHEGVSDRSVGSIGFQSSLCETAARAFDYHALELGIQKRSRGRQEGESQRTENWSEGWRWPRWD